MHQNQERPDPAIEPSFAPQGRYFPWHNSATDEQIDRYFGTPEETTARRPLVGRMYAAWEASNNPDVQDIPPLFRQGAAIVARRKQNGDPDLITKAFPYELEAGSRRSTLAEGSEWVSVEGEHASMPLPFGDYLGSPAPAEASVTEPRGVEEAVIPQVPSWANVTPEQPLAIGRGARVLERRPQPETSQEELVPRFGRLMSFLERWGIIGPEEAEEQQQQTPPPESLAPSPLDMQEPAAPETEQAAKETHHRRWIGWLSLGRRR